MEFGKWIDINEQLPPEPIKLYSSTEYLATVINNQVVAVDYVKTKVRNKEVIRWEYYGRICPWDIIAYMPFPEAYKKEELA